MKMSDNEIRCIKGNKTLQIKMHDGMVRKINYEYVIDIWKNLISLGTLSKHV